MHCRRRALGVWSVVTSSAIQIKEFSGPYRFLSNFYYVTIAYEGIMYPSTEHAFQASKSLERSERLYIAEAPTASEAKRRGRALKPIRSDWEQVRLKIMEDLLEIKFRQPLLRRRLLNTGRANLIEGNTWGDIFWGVCAGVGENHLGRLLMKIRDRIRKEDDKLRG